DCKCTIEKCDDNCKCKWTGKCGCNKSKVAVTSSGKCCKESGFGDEKSEKDCHNDPK
ncbi:hypothetical protein KR044_010370, partial [Drosophila immigrans]